MSASINVKFVVVRKVRELKDTTFSKIYEGTLVTKGQHYTFGGHLMTLDRLSKAVLFKDDVGDDVLASATDLLILEEPKEEPKVQPKNPKSRKGMSKRQFAPKFKRRIVKAAAALRSNGSHGDIKKMLDSHGLTFDHLGRWSIQVNSGVMKKDNAVAYSSNPSAMVRR